MCNLRKGQLPAGFTTLISNCEVLQRVLAALSRIIGAAIDGQRRA